MANIITWRLGCSLGTNRSQAVRMGALHPSSVTLSTGAPQGCVLRPLPYSPYSHNCTPTHSTNVFIKSGDDTTAVGLMKSRNWQSGAPSTPPKQKNQSLASGNREMNLLLYSHEETWWRVTTFKFPGAHIAQKITWQGNLISLVEDGTATGLISRRKPPLQSAAL